MKRSILITAILCYSLVVFSQNNQLSITTSSDIFERTYYDFLPDDQQFSFGLEYSKAIGKHFDLETGVLYSQSGFASVLCDFCEPHQFLYYRQTKEVSVKLGLRWRFVENDKLALYTALGVQGNRKIAPDVDLQIPDEEEDHLSSALYQDIGLRIKLASRFSIDIELKGRYNLPNESSLYYNRSDFKLGAGIGFNYNF